MYKKYSYIPKTLILVLKFENRKEKITFLEPSLYNIMYAEDLLLDKKYLEALKVLGINIKKSDFLSNPFGILENIFRLAYGNRKQELKEYKNKEVGFLPSSLDFLAKRYGKTPIEILKEITPSILESYSVGVEFNLNIENNKERENYKFKEKLRIDDKEMKQYNEIMERVKKHKNF